MKYTTKDIAFMQEAIKLARKGMYTARPNPCVGALLVRDGKVVGEGFHQYCGGDHAEVAALKNAGEQAKGATCYVTLEPCSHQGKTSPCVDALIKAKIKKVIVATGDPNPQVNGQGIKKLHENGITVAQGLLNLQAKALNPAHHACMQRGRPYVVVKSAMSFDGRTAMQDGQSKWITGDNARTRVQKLRANADAIITGIETVLKDDPQLNVRDEAITKLKNFQQPRRVVLDSKLRIPLNAKLLQSPGVIVATTSCEQEKIKQLQEKGVIVWQMQGERINLQELLQRLLEINCFQVLVESGATLNGAFWQESLVDEWHAFVAPTLLGHEAKAVLNLDVPKLDHACKLKLFAKNMAGDDFHLVFRPEIPAGGV